MVNSLLSRPIACCHETTVYCHINRNTYVSARELDEADIHTLVLQVVVGAVRRVEVVAQLRQVVRDVHDVVEHRLLHGEKDVLRRQLEPRGKQSLLSYDRFGKSGKNKNDGEC